MPEPEILPPEEIITWLEAAASGWDREPTPFAWGGKRQDRRERAPPATSYCGRLGCLHPTTAPSSLGRMTKWLRASQVTR